MSKPVVLVASAGESTWIVWNALRTRYPSVNVVLEGVEDRRVFLRRRVKRLGWPKVADQLLFKAYGAVAGRGSRRRIEEIKRQHGLDDSPPPPGVIHRVDSANAPEAIRQIQALTPAVVVVNGTRILSRRLLESVDAPFLNMHAGITPRYRGVHGGYWALAERDPDRCGVTVHLIDTGIDTGGILYQASIRPTEADDFFTYPMLQVGAGIPLLLRAVDDALAGTLQPAAGEGESRLWSHPGLSEYLWLRLTRGAR